MELGATLGLAVNRQTGFVRSPSDFLDEVMRLNPGLTRAERTAAR